MRNQIAFRLTADELFLSVIAPAFLLYRALKVHRKCLITNMAVLIR